MRWNSSISSYQSKSQKAQDAKSSALALMIVGILGIVIALLWAFDILPGHLSMIRRFLMCGILSVFSIVLLIMSYFSIRSFKELRISASAEDQRTAEILKWGESELKQEDIDRDLLCGADAGEEEKYFYRMERLRQCISRKFMNLEPDYTEDICEQLYHRIYETANDTSAENAKEKPKDENIKEAKEA